MVEFDVIMGMDWLASCYATVDCRTKRVHFHFPNEAVLEWEGNVAVPRVRVRDVEAEPPTLQSVPVVNEFIDVFPLELPGLPPEQEVEFGIDVIPGTQPISIPPYRMAPAELRELKEQLKDLLEKGFIRPSVSPWGAPMLFLQGAKCFSKIDLRTGYHQVRVKMKDIPKTALRTLYGHFKFLVMSFGLTNAPAIFMDLMNKVFKPFLDVFVIVFISWCIQDQKRTMQITYDRYYKFFMIGGLAFLGHIVSDEGIKVDSQKIEVVKDWPRPTTPTEKAQRGIQYIVMLEGMCTHAAW
ncbi:hypothetical protein KY284_007875 [Solanum tuberosum]|nr:hypothetical protein KY284_007875 [Solanum tuberosum]